MGDDLVEVDSESRLRSIRRSSFVATIGLAFLHIAALYDGDRTRVYLTKPTTMLIIIILAGVGRDLAPSRYANLILAGLACSLVGDIFLMLPSDQFVPGLVSFLIAHLFYIAAFRSGIAGFGPAWLSLPFFAYGLAAFWILLPGLGGVEVAGDRLPVGYSDHGMAGGSQMERDARSTMSVRSCGRAALCLI